VVYLIDLCQRTCAGVPFKYLYLMYVSRAACTLAESSGVLSC
jgi:hypothetical protein